VWIALWGRVRWQLGPVRFQAAGIGRPLVFAFGLLWLSGFCRDVYGMVSAASAAVFALTALSLLPASVPPPLTGPAKEEVLSELMETHAAGKRIFVIQFTGEWWEQDWCKRLYFDRFELADRPSPDLDDGDAERTGNLIEGGGIKPGAHVKSAARFDQHLTAGMPAGQQ